MNVREWLERVSSPHHHSQRIYQLIRALGALFTIFVVGTAGYHQIGAPKASWLDAAYMTVITLTTVGYGEIIPVTGNPTAEVFTILLIVFGMGTFLYFITSLATFVVEGELLDLLWRRSMDKKIAKMEMHVIVAGLGSTGAYVVPEVVASGRDCVLVDRDGERIQRLLAEHDFDVPYVVGDATDDATLEAAGIGRAAGVVFSLGNDRDNLFATISARQLNRNLVIVTRGEDPHSRSKFKTAGATSVIFTNVLGGARMAAEILRPEVTTFLDLLTSDVEAPRTIEEMRVPADSPLVGKKLKQLGLRDISDALVVAVREPGEPAPRFNPGPDYELRAESHLIILTLTSDIPRIEALVGGTRVARPHW